MPNNNPNLIHAPIPADIALSQADIQNHLDGLDQLRLIGLRKELAEAVAVKASLKSASSLESNDEVLMSEISSMSESFPNLTPSYWDVPVINSSLSQLSAEVGADKVSEIIGAASQPTILEAVKLASEDVDWSSSNSIITWTEGKIIIDRDLMLESFKTFKDHITYIEVTGSVVSTAFVYKTVMNCFTKAAFAESTPSSKLGSLDKSIPSKSLSPQARIMVAKSFAKYAAPMIVLSLVTIGLTVGRGSFSLNVGVDPNIPTNSTVPVENPNTANIESSTKSLSFLSLIT